ncbi:SBBP repeat-containing protein [candidate division WOR-3 bacterium]|nr:SBBP repeat-containing protein [candidate division WOR-3 bacterium]
MRKFLRVWAFVGTQFIVSLPSFAHLWVARYNGLGNGNDYATAIAIDGEGNIYVTGYSMNSDSNYDYATIKYNTSGDTLWVRRYNGPGNDDDEPSGIALDDSGNVYVTGGSHGSGTDYDYATVKYNSYGVEQWIRRYNGPGNYGDKASAIALDDSGNVYVTGWSYDSSFSIHRYDYATIKYNSSGDTLWVARYDGPVNYYDDRAKAIAVDDSGNVYVTGCSEDSCALGICYDYATIKYNHSGDTLWVRRYNGPSDEYDIASAIVVDGGGNVYVTGGSADSFCGGDYATVKYNSLGIEQWVARYSQSGVDWAEAIAVDDSGNVYVTGYSEDWWGCPPDIEWEGDYATVKYNSSGKEQWVRRYGGLYNWDGANAIGIDNSGNVYVTGTDGYSDNDYATIKYNSSGEEQWIRKYDGTGRNDGARAIALDDSGNVYVTGLSYGSGTGYDYATIKYSYLGVEERNERLEIRDWRLQIYPNPSFGNALIKYGLPEKANVSLGLYDISGRLVKTLYSGNQEKGYHTINVGAYHDTPTGIYFIKFETEKFKATRKLTILK